MSDVTLSPGSADVASIRSGGLITCCPADSSEDLAVHHRIRQEVFVGEQAVFTGSDRDPHDDDAHTIHLLGCYDGMPAGAVRLFPLGDEHGLWQGDRLCVLPPFRVHGVGAPLVRCAVATAGAHGGDRMVAHIQLPNVRFFTHLGWLADGDPEMYVGLAHQRMSIDLPAPEDGSRAVRELSAGIRH